MISFGGSSAIVDGVAPIWSVDLFWVECLESNPDGSVDVAGGGGADVLRTVQAITDSGRYIVGRAHRVDPWSILENGIVKS